MNEIYIWVLVEKGVPDLTFIKIETLIVYLKSVHGRKYQIYCMKIEDYEMQNT
jgi:hypothetical protein